MNTSHNSFAILLAGGSGNRMRGTVRDKCLEPLVGKPVLAHSVRAFVESGVIGGFVIVCRDDAQQATIAAALHFPPGFRVFWARGGAERQDSVLNGLEACPPHTGLVFIHDTARPLLTAASVRTLAARATETGAAVLAHRVKDTIKRIPENATASAPARLEDLDRASLWAMETPQVFQHTLILDAYRRVARERARITDDVAAAVRAGHSVALVENLLPNPKITEPHDLALVEFLIRDLKDFKDIKDSKDIKVPNVPPPLPSPAAQDPGEIFDVVDLNDHPVSRETRANVHRLGLLHRAIHVFVFRADGRVYLQQRSMLKDTCPGLYSASCAGHVDAGETYDHATARELEEELGIPRAAASAARLLFKSGPCANTGWEFVHVYQLDWDAPLAPNAVEISGGVWLLPAEVDAALAANPRAYSESLHHVWTLFRLGNGKTPSCPA
jgi:2-C-methyl-D-erythritol 4-phosphate cytidylyltransferase